MIIIPTLLLFPSIYLSLHLTWPVGYGMPQGPYPGAQQMMNPAFRPQFHVRLSLFPYLVQSFL